MIAAPMIYYVAAAKLMAYRQYKEFLDLAIAFLEARPHELNNICFLLSYHMHRIYEKCASNTIKSKDSIAQMLRVLYMQHANSKLADTYYYTTIFATMILKDHAPIFNVLLEPMRGCFHCRIQLSSVNFKEAIAYLNGIMPTQGRLTELKSIYEGQQKLETEVKAVLEASKKTAEGKSPNDDDDLDIQAQDVVISRNVQVLQPKKLTTTKLLTFGNLLNPTKIQGKVIKPGASSISSILDENNDVEVDKHIGRIYEPILTEIPIQEKNLLGPIKWQTLIFSELNKEEDNQEINRDSHYKKIWYQKPLIKNNLSYKYNQPVVPEFEHSKSPIQNEYNLPEEDKEEPECSIKTALSSELMRKISYSIDEREFDVSPLGEIFENQFVPKKIKEFVSDKEIVSPETVPAALRKLKKAREGDYVNLIKQEKSTHEELLKSLVFGVSRFLDIITPANVESLASLIAIFSKQELDENLLPWIYHHFSTNHYPKNFFTRYLNCVATYMKTVFLERDENNEMIDALIAYPYLVHIAIAGALSRIAKKPDVRVFSKVKQASSIHEFVNSTSFVISSSACYLVSKEINKQLTTFMVTIAPYCDEVAFLTTFNSYLRNLTNLQVVELVGNLEITKMPVGLVNFKCQLALLRCFAPQKDFVQAISAFNEPLFDSIFKNCIYAFQENDEKAIVKFIRSMSELSILAESIEGEINKERVNENTAKIADKIIDYLDIAINNYKNEVIQKDLSNIEHLLIPLLLVLHSAARDKVIKHFYELTEESKSEFFTYVYFTNLKIITNEGSPDPFEPLPNFITREEHLEYLEDKAINTKNVNYTLFGELSIRFVEFICKYIREHPLAKEILDNATIAVNSLFNRHQLRKNFEHCLYLLVYFVGVHSDLFYTGNTNINAFRSIVTNAYELVSYELQIARSTGVTILVHLMYSDYMLTNQVIISGYYIMEAHQKYCLEKNLINRRNQLLLYTNLVLQIDLYANNFSLKQFVKIASVMIDKLKVLHKYIKEKLFSKQSQQVQYAAIMKLADEFVEIPTLRLFWLEEMIKYNLEKKLLPQAYQSQVRAISLITSVIKGLGLYEDIPYSVDNMFAENFYYTADRKINDLYEAFPKGEDAKKLEMKLEQAKQKASEGTQASNDNQNAEENANDNANANTNDGANENNTENQAQGKTTNLNDEESDERISIFELKLVYYKSHKFTEEYLRNSILEAVRFAFDGNLVRQFSQISSLFYLQLAASEQNVRVFEKISTPMYFYLFGERNKEKTTSMRIYSTIIPNVDDFVKALLDEKSPLCCIKTTKFKINVMDSIVDAENKIKSGRFVIPVQSEKVVTFRGESSLFISDYIEPGDDMETWNNISVKRTFFKTVNPLPSDSIFVNANKQVVRTITRKALFSANVKAAADFLAISRSASRIFKRSVGLAPLVYSLNSTIVEEKSIAFDLMNEYKNHILDPDFNLLAKSFIQDISESMSLYVDRVRPMLNPQPAIEVYQKIYDAAQRTAKNLRVTDYSFTQL